MGYVVLFVCLFAGDTSKCNWDLGSLILKFSWASMKLVLIVTLESLETRLDQGVATLNCAWSDFVVSLQFTSCRVE